MPKDKALHVPKHGYEDQQEAQSLLAGSLNDEEAVLSDPSDPEASKRSPRRPQHYRRQSSLVQTPRNGSVRTPRTANRVRFDIEEEQLKSTEHHGANGHANTGQHEEREGDGLGIEWMDEEDYLAQNAEQRSSPGIRAPLLTDIDAPSVTVASADLDFNVEDLLESARPKSGMRSAFMNMANSIM